MLARLERLVRKELEVALADAQLLRSPLRSVRERAKASATRLGRLPWKSLLMRIRPLIVRHLGEFMAARTGVGSALRPHLRLMIAHERALLTFVQREVRGEHSTSVTAVRQLLVRLTPRRALDAHNAN